jgi:hypothetical protein
MASIPALQMEIANLEDERRTLEQEHSRANTQYTLGLLAILAGIAVMIFTSWLLLGVFLVLAGGLTGMAKYSQRARSRMRLTEIADLIKAHREEIVRLS